MLAYGVYQIILANTTNLRMAPQGGRAKRQHENKGIENNTLAGEGGWIRRREKMKGSV